MTTVTDTIARPADEERAWVRPLKAILSYGILFLLAAMFIYPFLLAISTSFKTLPEIAVNPVSLIPQTFTLEGYERLFSFNVGRWTLNSALVASIITLGNVFFASLAGLAPGGRTSFAAIAMDALEVELLGYPVLRELGDRHIAWQRALRAGIEHYGARKEKRERELLTLTPIDRYRLFIAEEETLAARIPQKDLALYLGVTPVALSRIRGRIARGS